MLIQVFFTLIFLAVFILIYRKYKTENEELLLLKLVGYYFLGGFRFNFNKIAIPLGFIIYLLFFRPQTNKSLKKYIAALGLIAFISGLLIPAIQKSYVERQRVVNGSGTNIYSLELSRDHKVMKEKLGINEYTKIDNFDASFESSGSIKELRYTFVTRNNEGLVIYNVNFSPEKNKYTIKPTKVSTWLTYDGLIDEEQFFYALKHLDLKQAKPQEENSFYTIKSYGNYTNWGVKNFENFLITDNGLKKLKSEELPVSGYVFWVYGNKKTSENSYSSDGNRSYIFPTGR